MSFFKKLALYIIKKLISLIRVIKWVFLLNYGILNTDKKLLILYDTSTQPFSIGDAIVVLAAGISLKIRFKLKKIDVVILYNPESPGSLDLSFKSLSSYNLKKYLSVIYSVFYSNRDVGSLYILDSYKKFEQLITDSDIYVVWPSGFKFLNGEYLYYESLEKIIYENWHNEKIFPLLQIEDYLDDWANDFFQKNSYGQVPITINIRNNNHHQEFRNTVIKEWVDFIKKSKDLNIKFFIICALSEVPDSLRDLENVIISRDIYTGVEFDLALIKNSAAHLGAGSGPMTFAWFSDKPYLMTNINYFEGELSNINLEYSHFSNKNLVQKIDQNYSKFCFSKNNQIIYNFIESSFILSSYLEEIWPVIRGEIVDKKTSSNNSRKDGLNWLK
ncbi:hypothetical protein LZG75_03435 [Polynucleobacter sp. IMCC30063]|uniref:hypothetical protein n=1 Tax=Polynucleobacter sp. IMCC30063 TaxID=2907298 RepID=UPI001F39772D|nr:hypothetical protein [Polynucleobacter sp. IMCC30063]MCE7505283.1 hypothetical protein [Polynucleobacter sp. IMCC30063]